MPGHSTGSLSVAGWSYSHNRAEFYRPAVSGWALENTGGDFVLYPAGDYQTRQVRFRNDGNVLFPKTVTIGNVGPTGTGTLALAVGGSVGARAVYVRAPGVAWPDYVFAPTYRLRPLGEVARFIQANGHLPDVPSAADVQAEGLDLGRMDALLLKKVEELTLYLLELKKENEALQGRVRQLEAQR